MKYEEVAKRIKKALYDNEMSAQDLANATGISKSSISHYVNGTHCPSNFTASKIGKVLGKSPAWLMGFDAPEKDEDIQPYAPGASEVVDLYCKATPEQRRAVLALLRSFVG